jgi:hypothetical protein
MEPMRNPSLAVGPAAGGVLVGWHAGESASAIPTATNLFELRLAWTSVSNNIMPS